MARPCHPLLPGGRAASPQVGSEASESFPLAGQAPFHTQSWLSWSLRTSLHLPVPGCWAGPFAPHTTATGSHSPRRERCLWVPFVTLSGHFVECVLPVYWGMFWNYSGGPDFLCAGRAGDRPVASGLQLPVSTFRTWSRPWGPVSHPPAQALEALGTDPWWLRWSELPCSWAAQAASVQLSVVSVSMARKQPGRLWSWKEGEVPGSKTDPRVGGAATGFHFLAGKRVKVACSVRELPGRPGPDLPQERDLPGGLALGNLPWGDLSRGNLCSQEQRAATVNLCPAGGSAQPSTEGHRGSGASCPW